MDASGVVAVELLDEPGIPELLQRGVEMRIIGVPPLPENH
ncbi:Uncharacterised protein [Streptococcus pneumoniae]|nr:Uncharacterised protein [Streptococcus pneumoniae]